MATLRFQALNELLSRAPKDVKLPSNKVTDYYGDMVFNTESMRKYLSTSSFAAVKAANEKGGTVDRKMADGIASGMKAWAIEKGATHYSKNLMLLPSHREVFVY